MDNINDFIKKFNNGPLKSTRNSLHELSQYEDLTLYKIFECKEKINKCLLELLDFNNLSEKFTSKIQESKDKLINNLNLKLDELFNKFYASYCSKFITEETLKNKIADYNGTLNDIPTNIIIEYDNTVRSNLGKLIFDKVDKNNVISYIKNVKTNETLSKDIIQQFVKNILCHDIKELLDQHVKELMEDNDNSKQFLTQSFGEDNYNMIINIITQKADEIKDICLNKFGNQTITKINGLLSDKNEINFQDFVILMDYISLISMDKEEIINSFGDILADFITPHIQCTVENIRKFNNPHSVYKLLGDISNDLGYNGDINNFEKSDVEKNASNVEQYFHNHIFDVANEPDKIQILQGMKNAINDLNRENDEEYIEKGQKIKENVYTENTDKVYGFIIQQFITEAQKIYKKKFSSTDLEKQEREDIVKELNEKYPDIPKKVGWNIVGNTKWKAVKQDFFKKNSNKNNILTLDLINMLEKHETKIKTYSYQDVVTLFGIILCIISDIELNYKDELKSFSKKYTEQLFLEYREEIDNKNKLIQQSQKKLEPIKNEKDEVKISEPTNSEQKEKKLLPADMIDDLENYFGGKIDQKLERYLKNCGGEYKKIRFKAYNVDDGFFNILDKYNFVCIDVVINETEDKVSPEPDENIIIIKETEPQEIIKLKDILKEIELKESTSDKVSLFMQGFRLLYDFLDEETIAKDMSMYCRDNKEILNGIRALLDMISKGQKEQIRSSKSRSGKYYKFDIGRTGYRLVLQNQKGSNRKIIIDLCDHDTYEGHCDFYYNFGN